MDNVERTPAEATDLSRKPYPRHMMVAALEPAELDSVVADLTVAGFAPERIDVVTAEDMETLAEPIGGSGLRGFLRRLNLSLGADLDEFERAGRELAFGHPLVFVEVHGDEEHDRAYDVLRRRGGHDIRYFGRWTIEALEGGDPDRRV